MKVIYEWSRRFLRRVELFTTEDLAKKPEIPLDTAKHLPIQTKTGLQQRWMKITDKKERKAPWKK